MVSADEADFEIVLGGVLVVELDEAGGELPARAAPMGGEVEEDDLVRRKGRRQINRIRLDGSGDLAKQGRGKV